MYHEYRAKSADEKFDELPEVGDEMEYRDETHIIHRVEVVNDSAIHIKTEPKRDVRYIEDVHHDSLEWEDLPERFLEDEQDVNFLDKNSLK
jgi:hypothetical protein